MGGVAKVIERLDCAVIGAGVVGLAVARALAGVGREVVVLEATGAIGSEASSRNSEVIHAGIYYPKDSLKARFCVAGRKTLYAYCQSRGIAHARCGKLIVATDDGDRAALGTLQRAGQANGVGDLDIIAGAAARAMEPALSCVAALHSPSTGIIDSHQLMLAYLGEAEAHGATVAFHSCVVGGACRGDGVRLRVAGAGGETELLCRHIVNAAGHQAQTVASSLEGLPPPSVPRRYLSKGSYFTMSGTAPFNRLIYPVPRSASLGIHFSPDLSGGARFGPDQEWVETVDYTVDPSRAEAFYGAVRRYYPDLAEGALQPGYSGIRAKVQAPGEAMADFVVQGPGDHGVQGLVNLYGIESPGLTASPAIAEHVRNLLLSHR